MPIVRPHYEVASVSHLTSHRNTPPSSTEPPFEPSQENPFLAPSERNDYTTHTDHTTRLKHLKHLHQNALNIRSAWHLTRNRVSDLEVRKAELLSILTKRQEDEARREKQLRQEIRKLEEVVREREVEVEKLERVAGVQTAALRRGNVGLQSTLNDIKGAQDRWKGVKSQLNGLRKEGDDILLDLHVQMSQSRALQKTLDEKEVLQSAQFEELCRLEDEVGKHTVSVSVPTSGAPEDGVAPQPPIRLTPQQMKYRKTRTTLLKAVDTLTPLVLGIMQSLLTYLTSIKQEQSRLAELIEEFGRREKARRHRLELEVNNEEVATDKLIPMWNDPNFKWEVTLKVRMMCYGSKSQGGMGLVEAMEKGLGMDAVSELTVREETFKTMSKPFSKGTFRSAYYGLDSKGGRYVIKMFHPYAGQDQEQDNLAADRTSKTHVFCQLVGNEFNHLLRRIRMDCKLSYVSAWWGHPILPANKPVPANVPMLMIEPLVNNFEKWTNNDVYVAEGLEGQLMAAYTHFSYHISSGRFIVMDHQGERITVATSGENGAGGGGTSTTFKLTDPCLQFIPVEGRYKLLDDLRHSMDGNRGLEGAKVFVGSHVCNGFCRAMRLMPLKAVVSSATVRPTVRP
ncbi:hypothetical protein HK102_000897 [Quaeritorhiza haematococci]|nr:hypothetical protein HK102_000897 [Quaeritorhiza haematococci]